MGMCCLSMMIPAEYKGMMISAEYKGNWTMEEIRTQMAAGGHLNALPLAEMQPGKLVKLEGQAGFFNPAPLLNPAWFEGRMSGDEYVGLVSQINECVLRSYVGLPKMQTRINGRLQGEDPLERAYTHLRAFMPAVTAWWMTHRGINVVLTIGAHHQQQIDHYHSKLVAPCALMFAILPAPSEQQLPRTTEGTGYVLTPPPTFAAPPTSAEGQPSAPTPLPAQGSIAVQPKSTS